MYIWKRTYNPFILGGNVNCNIKTDVSGFPLIDLGKGFKGIFIDRDGRTGVYEAESGGLVGDTIQEVRDDIAACDDIALMTAQVMEAKEEGRLAKEVSNDEFFSIK